MVGSLATVRAQQSRSVYETGPASDPFASPCSPVHLEQVQVAGFDLARKADACVDARAAIELEGALGQPLDRVEVVEVIPGSGRDLLHLSRRGVSAVHWVRSVPGEDASRIDSEAYRVEARRTGPVALRSLTSGPWSDRQSFEVCYQAGWVLDGAFEAWRPTVSYPAPDAFAQEDRVRWVLPTSMADPRAASVFFELVQPGVTGASEPSWPESPDIEVTDGTVVWASRAVRVLPDPIRLACALTAREILLGAGPPGGIVEARTGHGSVKYASNACLVSERAMSLIRGVL